MINFSTSNSPSFLESFSTCVFPKHFCHTLCNFDCVCASCMQWCENMSHAKSPLAWCYHSINHDNGKYAAQGPLLPTRINIIPMVKWLHHYKLWDEITYPSLIIYGAIVDVCKWTNNSPHTALGMWLLIHAVLNRVRKGCPRLHIRYMTILEIKGSEVHEQSTHIYNSNLG